MLRSRRAFVYLSQQRLLIGTYSGPGACVQEDWTQPVVWLPDPSVVTKAALGEAIRKAWSQCREIPLIPYKEVIAKCSEVVGASNLKKFFANVKLVSTDLMDGIISLAPQKQTAVDEFDFLPEAEIKLSEHVSDEELGAAVIEALRRCE